LAQSRRTFLATLGTAALGMRSVRGLAQSHDWVPAVQLYTVRGLMREDVSRTLAAVARIGYCEVEFAGYFGLEPRQIRRLVEQHGLTAPSVHVPFTALGADWLRTLDESAAAGHRFVTVPSIPAGARRSLDDWKRIAERFNAAGQAAQAADLRFAYHNHDFEFARVDGVVPFDLLLEETDPSVVEFQLDVYWMTRAGHDVIDHMTRHERRFAMLHLKDTAGPPDHRMVDVGAGTLDFARILGRASSAGVRHAFVEHDNPTDALASIRASYTHLTQHTA
jgi:sugar phosphate isomerase/epimerase